MTQFKVGDQVRHVDDRDGSFGVGEVVRIGRNKITVDWFDDSLDRKIPREDLELVEEQPNRTHYEKTATEHLQAYWGKNNYNAETGWTGDEPPLAPWERELIGTPFENDVHRILNGVAETVIQKNVSYGDSALNPIRIFSKADRMEQLFVRLDDKLSRVQRGSEYPGDDTLRDIIGYATLILIARESE